MLFTLLFNNNMKHMILHHAPMRIAWILMLMLWMLTPAALLAQSTDISLSKNSDFSTADRSFFFGEVIYVRVLAPRVNHLILDKNELNLSAVQGGEAIENRLVYQGDDLYTGVLDLSVLNASVTDWEVEIRLEDDNERELREKIRITITQSADTGTGDGDDTEDGDDAGTGDGDDTGTADGGDSGTGGDTDTGDDSDMGTGDGGDTGSGDGDDTGNGADNGAQALMVAGVIEAIRTHTITVSEMVFSVGAETVIRNENETVIPYSWLRVGAQVTISGIQQGADTPEAAQITLHLGAGVYFQLYQNYPNPFQEETSIQLEIFENGPVNTKVVVFDATGRAVAVLVDQALTTGRYVVEWRPEAAGRRLASGVYFCRVSVGAFVQTKKMILSR